MMQMASRHEYLSALVLILQITVGKPIGLDRIEEVSRKGVESVQLCCDLLSGLLGKNQMEDWGQVEKRSNDSVRPEASPKKGSTVVSNTLENNSINTEIQRVLKDCETLSETRSRDTQILKIDNKDSELRSTSTKAEDLNSESLSKTGTHAGSGRGYDHEREMKFERQKRTSEVKEAMVICVDMAVRLEQEFYIFKDVGRSLVSVANVEIRTELLEHLLDLVASFLPKVFIDLAFVLRLEVTEIGIENGV